MVRRVDITGQKFGNVTVLGDYIWNKHTGHSSYNCKCDCGVEVRMVTANLRSGNTTSCGCTMYDRVKGAKSPWYTGGKLTAEYRRQIKQAKQRELEFKITIDEMKQYFDGNCFYCGQVPTPDTRGLIRNGMDRKDSDKGYIKDNLVSCCFGCNHIKQDVNYNEFISRVELIYKTIKGAS